MKESAEISADSAGREVSISPPDSQLSTGDYNYKALAPVYDTKKIESLLLFKNKSTELKPNSLHNVLAYLRFEERFNGLFRYDRFAKAVVLHKEPFWQGNEPFKIRKRIDTDIMYVESEMDKLGINSPAKIRPGIDMVARENWINPPLEYFEGLKWDGKQRLKTWLEFYLGATGDQEYLAAVGMAWLIAGVARIYDPGCKAENMLVLEGEQGLLKSTALSVMANVGKGKDEESYFCDTLSFGKIRDKDTVTISQGKLIIEFQELANLGSREIEEVKAWMSIQVDEMRMPYGHDVEKFPRQFIMAASTNESLWLRDQTGNRRFWPVKCGSIDIPALINDREQLWAEAVHMYKNKSQWWIDKASPIFAKAQDEQDLRLLEDLWARPVEQFCEWKQFVTVPDILLHFKIDVAEQNKGHQSRVIGILKRLKYSPKQKTIGGKTLRGWERTPTTAQPPIDAEATEMDQYDIPAI